MAQSQYRDICFTSFDEKVLWFDFDWINSPKSIIQYIIVQGELCKDGKRHIQGYCQFKGRKRLEQIKKFFGDNSMHIEKRKGSHSAARDYCKQQKNGVWHEYVERGEEVDNTQGQRNDLIRIRDRIKEGITINEMMEETNDNKELHSLLQYNKPFMALERLIATEEAKKQLVDMYKDCEWRDWQRGVLELIKQKPDHRKVYWYCDLVGNTGKSYLSRYLQLTEKVYYITGGKQQDIFYAYENQPLIIYDLARSYQDNMDHIYTTIEYFKNGMFLSTKYKSEQRMFKIPHILVFANFEPHQEKLSQDRWAITKLA